MNRLKTLPFTLALAQMKYLAINLTKYVQDLYEKNHKAWIEGVKKELNGEKVHVHG